MLSAVYADGILSHHRQARLLSKPLTPVYERISADGRTRLHIYNVADGGFVLTSNGRIIGYSEAGSFRVETAPPAMLDMLQAFGQGTDASETTAQGAYATVQPLLGNIAWNQDSPFNDLCPLYDMSTHCPTGCVATAMAQVMRYHQWPRQGTGNHSYQPAVMSGNTLSADFGATTYLWEAMLPNYTSATVPAEGFTMAECREAVALLMLHCGVAVDMAYYSQSGATDYDVPPALTTYFGYDRGLAYRKREHYSTADWLQIIHDELEAGRPVLAYGRSATGGHAYVFDGMDDEGFIHVNWGWGGMSNGYFQTSALTPASQGIGGSDGGFNYSQRIITGIQPNDPTATQPNDYDIELTSTEGLSAAKKKIVQGAEVNIRLTGKVINHGWREAQFDYALLLMGSDGDTVKVIEGPANKTLDKDATDYAPDFGTVAIGELPAGTYRLYPACRMTGGTGPWLRIRDNYIGYVNYVDITATAADITFSQPDYFRLKATDLEVPPTIYSGLPTLVRANISNQGDVEYHGEVKAQLRQGNSVAATTSDYIVDLSPGDTTAMRFIDGYDVAAGEYTLCLVDDDGTVVSPRVDVTVAERPAIATVTAASPLTIDKALPGQMMATATVEASGGVFGGLLYTFIYSEDGKTEVGCLFPEYIWLDQTTPQQVVMRGTLENGIAGKTYRAVLAVYDGTSYTFLSGDNATQTFVLSPEPVNSLNPLNSLNPSNPSNPSNSLNTRIHDLLGRPANSRRHGIVIEDGRKTMGK